ncbi:hypothetical protein LOTGIDRAFT_168534 [Lottia gigantea]|uniref:G-protein coupled receptors family 1 profile domain-containing protein n=1 Tax=Lottia gigantea TaxID=225164 RepID=V4B7Q7_LOTGI|nr:hypothetical protein LOTGIDRAFT_168534 [Lottia gigantea]ESO84669.1 hypothetical protein LOTGIDRAFT_168534 [Lottia gigantea]
MTLVAIAVERYCAVCHLAQRFSVQNVNQGMLVVLTVSLILAFPSIGIFAVVPATDVQDINCSFPHVSNETTFCHFTTSIVGETVAYIYQGVLMLSFFISLIMIMIFYTIVYLVLWRRAKQRRSRLKQLEKEMSEKSLSSNGLYETSIYVTAHQTKITNFKMPNFSDVNKVIVPDHGPVRKYLPPPPTHKLESFNSNDTGFSSSSSVTTKSDRTAPSTSTGESLLTEVTRISATSMSTLMRSRHHNLHQRTAKMLFLCTVIYVISWMPFWFDIFGATSNIVLRYTFFVGNATNPIVYGIVNKHMRKAFTRILCNTSGNDVITNNNDKHCTDTSKECDKH